MRRQFFLESCHFFIGNSTLLFQSGPLRLELLQLSLCIRQFAFRKFDLTAGRGVSQQRRVMMAARLLQASGS